jgi:hypothetical protein
MAASLSVPNDFCDFREAYDEAMQRSMIRRYGYGFDWAGKPILKYRAGTHSPARALWTITPASHVAALQGLVEAPDQIIFIEGLAQEADCSSRQRARPETFVRKSSDKNYRQAMTLGNQVPMHINPAQTRHMHVRNDARGVILERGAKEFLGGSESGGGIAKGPHQAHRCLANGFIVIDDRDYGRLRQDDFPRTSSAIDSGALGHLWAFG